MIDLGGDKVDYKAVAMAMGYVPMDLRKPILKYFAELEDLTEIGKACQWWLKQCDYDLDYTIHFSDDPIETLLVYYKEYNPTAR